MLPFVVWLDTGPRLILNTDDSVRLEWHGHAIGTVFEEVIRRFNEENNQLIANLAFTPARSGTYLVYGGTCGTGGC